jgi:hypothetical protein
MKAAKPKGVALVDSPLEDRYDSYIRYANKLREVFGLNYTLECCAASQSETFDDKRTKRRQTLAAPLKNKLMSSISLSGRRSLIS